MTEIGEEAEQPAGSRDVLRAEFDELRRRVAVSDEEIDLLQVEAAKTKRQWYREPSVLVAMLALAVSVSAFVVGQINVITDRQIQDRSRLSALIEQLPTALAQAQENPAASADLVFLVAGSAAALIDQLGPEASTAYEKIEVAGALVAGFDLPSAKRLATAAAQQSTNVQEKIAADRIIANINFQVGDVAGGRDVYRRIISLLQTPENELDSPLYRDQRMVNIQLRWARDEFSFAKSCEGATEQLKNAKQRLDGLPPDRVASQTKALDGLTTMVAEGCPTAVK